MDFLQFFCNDAIVSLFLTRMRTFHSQLCPD